MIKNKWYNSVLIDIISIIESNKNDWYNSIEIIDIIAVSKKLKYMK